MISHSLSKHHPGGYCCLHGKASSPQMEWNKKQVKQVEECKWIVQTTEWELPCQAADTATGECFENLSKLLLQHWLWEALGSRLLFSHCSHAADLMSPWPQLVTFVIWSPVGTKSTVSFLLFFLPILSCSVYERAETWPRHKSHSALAGFLPGEVEEPCELCRHRQQKGIHHEKCPAGCAAHLLCHWPAGNLEQETSRVSFSRILKAMRDIQAPRPGCVKPTGESNWDTRETPGTKNINKRHEKHWFLLYKAVQYHLTSFY